MNGSLSPSNKPPWSPKAIGVISFFFSFLPAGILHTLNERRLGKEVNVPLRITLFALGFAAFMWLAWLSPDSPAVSQVFTFLNAAIAYFFYRSQAVRFREHVAAGGEVASPLRAAGISFVAVLVVGGALIGYLYTQDIEASERFEEARLAMERGDYEEAEEGFVWYRDYDEEEPATFYNLAAIYEETGREEEAVEALERCLEVEPLFPGAREELRRLRSRRR